MIRGFFGHPEVRQNIGFVISLYAGTSICLIICGKSAGNYNVTNSLLSFVISRFIRTSETLRDILPNNLIHINHNKPNDKEFGSYLAGLWEADGHASSSQQIIITFCEQDKYFAQSLANLFEHGNLYNIKNKKAVNWVISNKTGIIKFLNLINGHIRIERKLIQIRTNLNSYLPFCTPFQSQVNTSSLLQSYWLAGFTDGDGSFYIQIITRKLIKRKPEVRLHFKFSLKDYEIIEQLSSTFGSSLSIRKHPNGSITYYWSSTSFTSALKVHNYFHTYSLQSSKWLNFLKWRKAFILFYKNFHLSEEGLKKIIKIKNSLNSKSPRPSDAG